MADPRSVSSASAGPEGGSSRPPQSGDLIAGKYRVDRVVGQGGMGVVVAAQHVQLGQSVAIKVLSLADLEEARRNDACVRFLREGQAAARLTSDHVVRIYDVGTLDSGAPFMVMELLRGDDLSTLLDRTGSAPLDVAIDYIVQACDAVGEAHALGIVHRDLKPSNLFVSLKSDGRAHVKVLDFGISKSIAGTTFDGSLTETRSVVGSPYYMSPEQVRDSKRVDTRTDIWSLGVILYELIAGRPAFNADTLPGICAAIAADEPEPLRTSRPEVPPEIEAIVLRCLQKNPDKRFQTTAELVRALEPFITRSVIPNHAAYASRPQASLLAPDSLSGGRNQPTIRLEGEASGMRPSAGSEDLGATSSHEGPIVTNPPEPGGAPRRSTLATLVSSTGRTVPSPTPLLGDDAPPPAERRSRAPYLLVFAGCVVAGIVGFSLLRPADGANRSAAPAAHGPESTTQPPPSPARFALIVESEPAGANVVENDRIVGTTPLVFPILTEDVERSPRHFELRLDGYEAYSFEQGASQKDVTVHAKLTPGAPKTEATTAAPSAAPPPPAAPAHPVRVAAPRARPAPVAKPAPAAKPAAAPSDIRLER